MPTRPGRSPNGCSPRSRPRRRRAATGAGGSPRRFSSYGAKGATALHGTGVTDFTWTRSCPLGGEVTRTGRGEYGRTTLRARPDSVLLHGQPSEQTVWMSHGDAVTRAPGGFRVIAETDDTPVAAIEDPQRNLYGVQYHPEVSHTPLGGVVLDAFLSAIGARRTWTAHSVIAQQVEAIRAQVGDGQLVCGLSGGVDSAVAAALGAEGVGDPLTCAFGR